jgi:ubiquinone/menaquinone biosynthesis C-methylase UbiE
MAVDELDYDRFGVAAAYRAARALPDDTVRLWTDVLRRAVVGVPMRYAVDVGAGTGRFTRVLRDATGAAVVAVEPSRGMLEAREPVDAAPVQAAAEALPIRTGAVDLTLLSMVYHQLRSPDLALRELRRVLRRGGVALVRTATRETLDDFVWLRCFPESLAIDRGRMPARAAIAEAFRAAGFSERTHTIVRQRIARDLAEYAARVRSRAFSSLQALPDDVWAHRLGEFERFCRAASDGPVEEPVAFFVFVTGD